MDPIVEIEQLKAQVSALEDLTVVALALALKSTPPKYQQMMNMWLLSISRVDLATFNTVEDLDLDGEDEVESAKSGPVEGTEALKFEQIQTHRTAGRRGHEADVRGMSRDVDAPGSRRRRD